MQAGADTAQPRGRSTTCPGEAVHRHALLAAPAGPADSRRHVEPCSGLRGEPSQDGNAAPGSRYPRPHRPRAALLQGRRSPRERPLLRVPLGAGRPRRGTRSPPAAAAAATASAPRPGCGSSAAPKRGPSAQLSPRRAPLRCRPGLRRSPPLTPAHARED